MFGAKDVIEKSCSDLHNKIEVSQLKVHAQPLKIKCGFFLLVNSRIFISVEVVQLHINN